MNRTKLINRILPSYTKGEEIFNMVSHIAGGVLGVVALLICVILAAYNQNVWGIVSGAIYGFTLIRHSRKFCVIVIFQWTEKQHKRYDLSTKSKVGIWP